MIYWPKKIINILWIEKTSFHGKLYLALFYFGEYNKQVHCVHSRKAMPMSLYFFYGGFLL